MSTREAPGSVETKAWGPSASDCTPELHPPLDLGVQWPWGQNKQDYVRFWAVFPSGSSPAGALQRQRVGRGGMAQPSEKERILCPWGKLRDALGFPRAFTPSVQTE